MIIPRQGGLAKENSVSDTNTEPEKECEWLGFEH